MSRERSKEDWTWRDTLGAWSLVVFVIGGIVTAIVAGITGLNGGDWIYTEVFGTIAAAGFFTLLVSFVLVFRNDERIRREGIDNG